MVVKKQTDSTSADAAFKAESFDWFQQFLKRLEINLAEASERIDSSADATVYHLEVVRAVKLTLRDSGMDEASIQATFGQVAFEESQAEGDTHWTPTLNQRRFELIDGDIQGTLSGTEQLELAALTQLMRKHVDSEVNLPIAGAKALHRLLLEADSPGDDS